MLGGIGGRRKRGRQWMSWLDGITGSMDTNLSQLWEITGQRCLVCCSPWGLKELDTTERLNTNNQDSQLSVCVRASCRGPMPLGRGLAVVLRGTQRGDFPAGPVVRTLHFHC